MFLNSQILKMGDFHKLSKLLEEEDILNVLDTLHLDEYIVDEGINKIISRTNVSKRQLNTLLIFIKYKLMLCLQEDEDCGNCVVGDYILQQLLQVPDVSDENFQLLLKLLSYSLMLNVSTLTTSVEHITQQLISEIIMYQKTATDEELSKCIVYLMICDCLFIACVENGVKLNSRFLKLEFQEFIDSKEKKIQKHIFSQTIPNMINCCEDVTFLNFVSSKVFDNIDNVTADDVLLLCILSDYYFPSSSKIDNLYVIKSFIVKNINFWKLIERGIADNDGLFRKYCIYLAKRAIDFILENNIKINLKSTDGQIYIICDIDNKLEFEDVWKSFFIIMETLEEKQAHLVAAALNLLYKLENIQPVWYNCVLKRALIHETDSIVKQALEISLRKTMNDQYLTSFPYNSLLSALNKVSIYEDFFNSDPNSLYMLMKECLKNKNVLTGVTTCSVFKSLSIIPKYCLSYVLSTVGAVDSVKCEDIQFYIEHCLNQNITLNNPLLEGAIQCNILNFSMNNLTIFPEILDLQKFFFKFFNNILLRNTDTWNQLKKIVMELNTKENSNSIGMNSIEIVEKQLLQDPKSIAKLILLLYDASILKDDAIITFFNSKLIQLKECGDRLYAADTEFDSLYFFINTFIVDESDHNDLCGKLRESFKNSCDSIRNYLLRRIQNISQTNEFDFINRCVDDLDDLLTSKDIGNFIYVSIQPVIDQVLEILKCPESDLIKKYFGLKILCSTSNFVENNNFFYINERSKIFTNYFEASASALYVVSSKKNEDINKGRIMSALNETSCNIYYLYYKYVDVWTLEVIQSIYENVLEFLEKGGSKCIASTIKLSGILLKKLIEEKRWDNITNLLEYIWKEMMEVRKNEQFRKSLKEFVVLLFNKDMYACKRVHSILIDFGTKLFECGDVAPYTVFVLMQQIKTLSGEDMQSLLPLITKALLFGSVPRKDQRIELEICNHAILRYPHLKFNEYSLNLNEEIKMSSLEILLKQKENFHNNLIKDLRERASILLKNKQRYHGNSMTHRLILRIFQSLLLSWNTTLINSTTIETVNWCINILINQPHHISIRIFAEWYIALHLSYSDKLLKDNVEIFGLSQLSQLSYFMVIYHVVKHQLLAIQGKIINRHENGDILENNYNFSNATDPNLVWKNFVFALETFMPFTMGQLFNIRLHAQYLTCKLYESVDIMEKKDKYSILYDTIQSNFDMNSDEKNFKKIQCDFFTNNFDILHNLNVENVYNMIPKMVGITHDELISEKCSPILESTAPIKNNSNNISECENNEIVNIQKKFIPWEKMFADLNIATEKKNISERSGLIIVASLIDKLPNLGGLSRTCEVFGVKQLAIGSTKFIQDKQFQSLSVSSENWVNIVEVQPGTDLKNYLIGMKTKGYKIVGAEQSSSSVMLDKYTFPKNTILLLGHEKEGISPDLLNILDDCVEVPQQGMVRSLNVHVTASIFIWEYCKQHKILGKIQ